MTESRTDWQLQATKRLDVRPILAEGGEPFALILETTAPPKTGETLLLIAPFEPIPSTRCSLSADSRLKPGSWGRANGASCLRARS